MKKRPIEDENDRMLPFTFDLSESALYFVDNADTLIILKDALADCVILGIDTETKPVMFKRRKIDTTLHLNPTALVQMAVRSSSGLEAVFIIDMLTLARIRLLPHLDQVLLTVMQDERCIKVGQSLINDFRELNVAYRNVKSFQRSVSIVDTTALVKLLQPDLISTLSLKTMVKQYLHFNLVKTLQMSDWSRRPLTNGQRHYAACDALVLLRLYDAMCCEAERRFKGEFDVMQCAAIWDHTKVKAKVKKGRAAAATTAASSVTTIVNQLKRPRHDTKGEAEGPENVAEHAVDSNDVTDSSQCSSEDSSAVIQAKDTKASIDGIVAKVNEKKLKKGKNKKERMKMRRRAKKDALTKAAAADATAASI